MKIAILTCPFEPPKPKTKHKVSGRVGGCAQRRSLAGRVGLSHSQEQFQTPSAASHPPIALPVCRLCSQVDISSVEQS